MSKRIVGTVIQNYSYVKMTYNAHGVWNNVNGSSAMIAVYRGNSVYDPDYNLAGHEAMGNSQWVNFYRKYCVLGSKIVIDFDNLKTDRSIIVTVLPSVDVYGVSSSLSSNIREQPGGITRQLGAAVASGNRMRIKMFRKTKTLYPEKLIQNDEQMWGSLGSVGSGSNPNNNWFWNICMEDFNEDVAVNNVNVQFNVKLTYYVKIFVRQAIVRSGVATNEPGATGVWPDVGPTGATEIQ